MSKNRLLSGRVKKLTGAALDANRATFLSLDNAEPDLGLPSANGQVIISSTAGVRSFLTLATVATSGSYADLSNKPTLTSTLGSLTDVAITTPTNQQVLVYNTGTSKWINSPVNVPYFVLSGATIVYINQVVSYIINDFDSFSTYSISVTAGSASISGNTITFTTPSVAGTVTMTISNGTVLRSVSITVLTSGVQAPTVTNPASSPYTYYIGGLAANSIAFTTSSFVALGAADTHLNSDWQLATDAGFTTFASQSLASTANKTTWTQTLATVGTFYLRVRHRGTANGASAYSSVVIITVFAATVQAPSITSPTSGTINYNSPNVTFASSAFTYLGTFDAHASSDWQLSTDNLFGTTVQTSTASASNLTSWTVTDLSPATTYYARVRYTGSTNGTSAYSAVWNITTISQFSSYIATPTATPAIGASFEGGYYAGLIWNELAQSSTSFAIGNGQKTFTVPDMTSVPIVYQGQTVQVRSRANPSVNYMTATVAQAGSSSLVLNVSASFGSGTFTDWSVMSLFRVIVAPKASGEAGSLTFNNSNTAGPAASQTLSEGYKSTMAMKAANIAASNNGLYPAAYFCYSLNIAGRTDWYNPSRDELELVFRNLKPHTASNYTGTDRPLGYDYKLLGSPGDTSTANGVNPNSSPVGSAYTLTVPAQTSIVAFQTGGTEAPVSTLYGTSSDFSTIGAWYQSVSDLRQYFTAKNGPIYIRAVRRSII